MDTSKKFCVWKPSLTSLSGGFFIEKIEKLSKRHGNCMCGFGFYKNGLYICNTTKLDNKI